MQKARGAGVVDGKSRTSRKCRKSPMKGDRPTHLSRRRILRVGYVPLCDCAPLVMAQELGLFEKYGLHVHLSREAGWATVRDKIIYGELDAAHALAPMVIAATLGLGSAACECV